MDDLAINERIEDFLLHEGVSEDELMHFGVKGMRWGVRKGNSSSSSGKQPMSTKKKVAIGVGVGVGAAAAVAGAFAVRKVLNRRLDAEVMRHVQKANSLKFAAEAVKKHGSTPVSSIKTSLKVSSLSSAQREGLQKVLATGDKSKVVDWLRQYHTSISGIDLNGLLI